MSLASKWNIQLNCFNDIMCFISYLLCRVILQLSCCIRILGADSSVSKRINMIEVRFKEFANLALLSLQTIGISATYGSKIARKEFETMSVDYKSQIFWMLPFKKTKVLLVQTATI